MKYIKRFKNESDYQTFRGGGDWITPNVSVINDNNSSKPIVILNKKEKSLFPMYLTLTKVGNEEYRLDPTPESIALCDFLLNNMTKPENGYAYEYHFSPGQLYINNKEIQGIWSDEGYFNSIHDPLYGNAITDPFIFGFVAETMVIYWKDGWSYPKGTIRIINDD